MRRMAFLLGLTFAVGIAVGKMGFQVLNAQQDLIRLTRPARHGAHRAGG
jgi:hypothetical protein